MERQIFYQSTRGQSSPVAAAAAILEGIAGDGGLYVPSFIPQFSQDWPKLIMLDYRQLAYLVMRDYLPDFSVAQLKDCIDKAYDHKFDSHDIAPLVKRADAYFLELYHGPTLAFKDMALTILPHLLKKAASICGTQNEIVILTATSGDTGKAALEGFAGVDGTKIIVFYPENGVSPIQKRQMVTQEESNTFVVGIEGNFDDAQSGVKKIFADCTLREEMAAAGMVFSSANSINIGRLIPQIVYYYHAYLRLIADGQIEAGEKINFAVPTGNFGNILAGYYAKKMGLPINRLICASNQNKVLYDFFTTGAYDRNRDFVVTMSPSMDILISSNLERLLFDLCQRDSDFVQKLMKDLAETGRYSLTAAMQEKLADFEGGFASEQETAQAIRDVYRDEQYLIDTHTAVAYSVWKKYVAKTADHTKTVVVSTAAPFKFTADVLRSLDEKYDRQDDFALLAEMGRLTGHVPVPIQKLLQKEVRHTTVCSTKDMRPVVKRFLGLQGE
jgi:threonine synthase